MNSVVKQMFAVLMLVGGISGLILAGTEKLTQPLIEKHKREELQKSIFVVLPNAKDCERNESNECKNIGTEEFRVYKGLNEQNEAAGYAFIAEGAGFQGKIRMIVGIDADVKTLLGMKVLEQVETPGLGAKIAEETPKEDFFEQFAGLKPVRTSDSLTSGSGQKKPATEEPQTTEKLPANFIKYVKNEVPDEENEVQAITGATISSKAVVGIINQSLANLWNIVGKTQRKGGEPWQKQQ